MFCPNCGTKNDETATPCTKCGFKLTPAPKFRGTMMLNSDQSVQEMVEEHRRKLAETSEQKAEPAPEPVVAAPPSPGGSVPPRAVLQPPRVGTPKKRMGTMLGVAPQVGGVRPAWPPSPSETPPPVSTATQASPSVEPPARSAPDPFAGTVAFGAISPLAVAPASSPSPVAAGRTEAFAAVPPAPNPSAGARTEAVAAVAALAAVAAPAATPPAPAFGRTEAFAAPVSAPGPAPAAVLGRTAAFEQPAEPPATQPRRLPQPSLDSPLDRDSVRPPPVRRQRARPLDVFLIVITFGLWGLVMLARQRKRS